MLSAEQSKQLVVKKINDSGSITLVKDIQGVFVFVYRFADKQRIPSGLIIAVNKETGKLGVSVSSEKAAINKAYE